MVFFACGLASLGAGESCLLEAEGGSVITKRQILGNIKKGQSSCLDPSHLLLGPAGSGVVRFPMALYPGLSVSMSWPLNDKRI